MLFSYAYAARVEETASLHQYKVMVNFTINQAMKVADGE